MLESEGFMNYWLANIHTVYETFSWLKNRYSATQTTIQYHPIPTVLLCLLQPTPIRQPATACLHHQNGVPIVLVVWWKFNKFQIDSRVISTNDSMPPFPLVLICTISYAKYIFNDIHSEQQGPTTERVDKHNGKWKKSTFNNECKPLFGNGGRR